MKVFLLLSVAMVGCLVAAPVLADTYYFAMTSDDTMLGGLNLDSIRDLGDNKKSAEMVAVYNGQAAGAKTKYSVATIVYDCKNRRLHPGLTQNFDASGALIKSLPAVTPAASFEAVKPTSVGGYQLVAVCDSVTSPDHGISHDFDNVQAAEDFLDGFYAYRHPTL